MNNLPTLAVRWVRTESGRILMESYKGPQKELPTICVEYEKMPDGSTRVVREWVAGDRPPP